MTQFELIKEAAYDIVPRMIINADVVYKYNSGYFL